MHSTQQRMERASHRPTQGQAGNRIDTNDRPSCSRGRLCAGGREGAICVHPEAIRAGLRTHSLAISAQRPNIKLLQRWDTVHSMGPSGGAPKKCVQGGQGNTQFGGPNADVIKPCKV